MHDVTSELHDQMHPYRKNGLRTYVNRTRLTAPQIADNMASRTANVRIGRRIGPLIKHYAINQDGDYMKTTQSGIRLEQSWP